MFTFGFPFTFFRLDEKFHTKAVDMLANQRRDKIFELLKEDGSAKVIDLARLFKVTEVTIRQDLEKLEKEGLAIREHGGAYLRNIEDQVKSFSLAHQDHIDKKELIAKK